jgi:DmsE family decaheme c-type cytochrome
MSRTGTKFNAAMAMMIAVFGLAFASAMAAAVNPPGAPGSTPAPIAAERSAPPKAKAAKPQQPPAQAAGTFVGDDTCMTCHDTQSYKNTAHGRAFDKRTPMASGHGCESCHGPGKDHVDGGGDTAKILNPAKVSPTRASEVCVTCHDRGKHALWDGSQHDQRKMGCVTCHSVHNAKGPAQLKAKDEQTQCATCHKAVTHKQMRFNHMPVREGKMTCSSCHNVHGSANVKLLKTGTTIDEACVSCHAEKRGPFLWEHAPVAESCTTCHDPHGSNNERMLVSKMPFLCQRCHVTSRHPPTVYDGFVLKNSSNGNKIFGRSCLNCHQQIHGSNAPSGKALLR